MSITQADIALLLSENYFSFLIICGLLILIYAYRDVHLPASRNFRVIVLVLLMMSITNSIDCWAALSVDRVNIRFAASLAHYVLQPFVIYLELLTIIPDSKRADKAYRFRLAMPAVINAVIYLISPLRPGLVIWFSPTNSFHRTPLGCTVYVVTFYYLVLLLLWSIRLFRQNNYKISVILQFMAGVAVMTAVFEFSQIATGYIDEAFALGALFYYMYLVTQHEAEMQASLARNELELSRSKVKLLRQQIRPHFIFNSLQIIKSLIKTDRAKAITSLENFSDYLSANIDAITSDSLIPFEDELVHTEAYVALVLADDSKNITVEYDIEEKYFRLPPLTLEPIVENAIRHGLKHGGIVRISTRNEDDNIVIVVYDNGEGFEFNETEQKKERLRVGIENVRTRLAMLCNGTLDIRSDDSGTEVTMCIPRQRS